jgi:hypothetical protein
LLFRRMNVTAKRSCKNYPAVKSLITKIFTWSTLLRNFD